MSNTQANDIEYMYRAHSILINLPTDKRNAEYNAIYELISKYIDTQCVHHIIYDTIDITPDHSKTIQYCDRCYKTFSHPS